MDPGITVTVVSSNLLVVEGNVFSLCVSATATNESFQEFVIEVEPTLEFITAGL